jgi:hypothetical protein
MEGLEVKRTLALMALCAVMALLTACGREPLVVEKPVIQYVEKRVECPSAEEREKLRQARPKPLRDTPMPDSVVERNGKTEAQLGKYEATGGYADQVDAALDRCQQK